MKLDPKPQGGGVSHLLWYYNQHKKRKGFTIEGKIHAAHSTECRFCHKTFRVYHYRGCRWTKIKFCSLDCAWEHYYGRPFLEGEENRLALRREASQKTTRHITEERRLRQHLVSVTPRGGW